jgi:hypothetical protein
MPSRDSNRGLHSFGGGIAVEGSADSSLQVAPVIVRVGARAPEIAGDEKDSWERIVDGGCYSTGEPWYHDQVGTSLHPTSRMEEPLSREAKLDSMIWIRAIKLPHGEQSGRGYELNAVGSRDAGVG